MRWIRVSTRGVEFQLGGEVSWVSKHWYLERGWSRGTIGAVRFGGPGYLVQKVARLRVGESSS